MLRLLSDGDDLRRIIFLDGAFLIVEVISITLVMRLGASR
jgi:hypothetical protein